MKQNVNRAIITAIMLANVLYGATPVSATPHDDVRAALCATAATHAFSDVTGIHSPNVGCVAAFGIAQGTSPTTFQPHGPLRREALATLLTNFLALATGSSYSPPTVNPFVDVQGSVHADNIAIAAAHNLTQGVTATRFAPQRLVTRDQFASLLVNTLTAAGHPLPESSGTTFTDLTGNIHASNITRLAAAGIVAGATAQRFNPKAAVTRQQAATLLLNAAAELHLADRWHAGSLAATTDTPNSTTNPQATVQLSQITLNGVQLGTDETNQANNDPLVLTGTAAATESTIVNVQARIDGGAWQTAIPTQGTFSQAQEPFRLVLQDVPDGIRELTIRAIDADGLSSTLMTFTLAVTKPPSAQLTTAVTDPAQNRILLTFDQSVSCVDTPTARAAWQFNNQSQHVPVVGQAAGAPDSIDPLINSAASCALNYTTSGIRVSDYGTVSYTRPDPDHAVKAGDGQLQTVINSSVIDGFAPTLVSASINAATNNRQILLTFSEPMLCRSFSQSDFWISVSGATNSFEITAVDCSATSADIRLTMAQFEFVAGMQVNVAVVIDVFDASGDNKAPAPVMATTVVT